MRPHAFAAPLAVVLAVAGGVARAGDAHYLYEGRPVPLVRDGSVVAVFEPASPGASEAMALTGWRLAPVPVALRAGSADAALAVARAATDAAFASPVFRDARGGVIVPTRDLLVAFDDTPGAHAAIAPGFDVVQRDVANMPGVLRVRARAGDGAGVLDEANRLARLPGVRWAEPDFIFTAYAAAAPSALAASAGPPNDPRFAEQWGLENTGQLGGAPGVDLNATEAWAVTLGDPAAPVVIFDVGVEPNHPDLNLVPGADFTTESPALPGQSVNACDIHGSWVAGVLAATFDNAVGIAGIAPDSGVASARIGISNTPACTLSWSGQLSWTVDAIDWAESIGARVTNNSNAYNITSSAIRERYEQTRAAGMVHFASAGNDFGAGATYPAAYDGRVVTPAEGRSLLPVLDGGAWREPIGSAIWRTSPTTVRASR